MRSILVLGLVATLTVAAVESLECVECWEYSTSCNDELKTCPDTSNSCGVTVTSWPAATEDGQFLEKFCSAQQPGSASSFAVRVPGDQPFLFADKFCTQGEACDPTLPEAFTKNGTGDTQCPTCLALDTDSCVGTNQTCNDGERCVDLFAEITTERTQKLTLMGCSNITESLCSGETQINIGKITIHRLKCEDPEPIQTPDSNTTTFPSTSSNSSSSSNITTSPSTSSNSSSSSNITTSPSTSSNSSSSSNITTSPSTSDSSDLIHTAKLPWIASLVLGLLLL